MKKIIFFVVSGVAAYFCMSYGGSHFVSERCHAEFSFIRGDEKLNLVTFQHLFSGVGTVSVSGILSDRGKTVGYISKTISFSYEKKDNVYLATSRVISVSPQMSLSREVEKEWFPPFFYDVGQTLVWTARPVTHHSSLILTGTTPLFICEKNAD